MEFLLLILSILFLGYYLLRRKYNYWSDRGVPTLKPQFPFGNVKGVSFSKTLPEIVKENYLALKGKGPVGGLYFFTSPQALILDLDLLRTVFVKDFEYFQNRGTPTNEKKDPLSGHLFSLEGDRWKNMRAKLSPTFTSGKMKMMHSTLMLVADQFKEHLRPMAEQRCEVEIKELLAQFTTDVIGSTAFGIECNSMKDPNSEFRKKGRQIFAFSKMQAFKRILFITFGGLAKKLNMRIMPKEISDFFINTVKETVEYREKNNIQRNDFMHLLMQIKNTGKVDGEMVDLGTLSIEELAAQIFVFFIAGFETSSSTMTFSLYELAMNQELQDKTRGEILQVLERFNGVLTYDAAMEMTFLDQVINETLRKYPIVAIAFRRKVEKDYLVPNTNIVLEKDTIVQIPVLGIHHDPAIYPNPDVFDPERFTKANIAARHPYAWIPFGEGPRNCIGMRFAMMETRIGLATILTNYRLSPSQKTPRKVILDPRSNVLSTAGGMHLRIELL